MIADLRPARPTDAGATGDILWRFQHRTSWMPDLYSGAQTVAFCGAMIDRGWVTVAVLNGRVEGFLARDDTEICALYLSQTVRRRGIGQQLLDHAKSRSKMLKLRVFQGNVRAQRFYLRQGFAETGRGDGADNDENLPDIAYIWPREAAT